MNLKRMLYALVLTVMLAGPTQAATGSATWDGSTDGDWNVDTNWTPEQHPADGDTATFDGGDGGSYPSSNEPAAGTIHFVFTAGYIMTGGAATIEDDILGNAGAAIGNITVNHADAAIVPGANFGSTICTITAGSLVAEGSQTCTGDIVVQSGGTLGVDAAVTLQVSGGTVELQAGGTYHPNGGDLDLAEPMRIVGAGDHAITFQGAGAAIYGGIDASSDGTARQVTVSGATGDGSESLTLDVTGDFDLGTDGASGAADWSDIQVNVAAGCDQTLRANASVYGLLLTDGTDLDMSSLTITVDAGGCDHDGTVPIANPGTITFAAATAVAEWQESYGTLDIDAAVTFSGKVDAAAIDIGAALDVNDQDFFLEPSANNWWTQAAAVTDGGGGGVAFVVTVYGHRLSSDRTNADEIDLGGDGDIAFAHRSGGDTLKLTGGLTCDEVGFANANDMFIVDMDGGNLACGAIEFQEPNLATLNLGEGSHTITGTVAQEDANDLGAIDIETSTVRAAEGMDLDDIALDLGEGCVIVTGTGKNIDGDSATSVASNGAVIIDDGNATPVVVKNLDTTDLVIVVNGTLGTGGDANGAGIERQVTDGMMRGMGF